MYIECETYRPWESGLFLPTGSECKNMHVHSCLRTLNWKGKRMSMVTKNKFSKFFNRSVTWFSIERKKSTWLLALCAKGWRTSFIPLIPIIYQKFRFASLNCLKSRLCTTPRIQNTTNLKKKFRRNSKALEPLQGKKEIWNKIVCFNNSYLHSKEGLFIVSFFLFYVINCHWHGQFHFL